MRIDESIRLIGNLQKICFKDILLYVRRHKSEDTCLPYMKMFYEIFQGLVYIRHIKFLQKIAHVYRHNKVARKYHTTCLIHSYCS